jgi:hypothetical protein
MRRLLELQASQIETLLASHKIKARIWGGTVTPRLIRFHLSPALDTRLSHIARLAEELALSLGSPSCRVARRGGTIDLEFPRTHFVPVHLLPLCTRLPNLPPCTAVLGLDEEGTPLLLRLPSPEVTHVLISGTTGCGKTSLAQTMIASARAMAIEHIAERAAAYGMPGTTVDGNDVLAVYDEAKRAVGRAREGDGPSLIECETYRYKGHSRFEPATYRPEGELEAWLKKDPLTRFRRWLEEEKVLAPEEAEAIRSEVEVAVADAVAFAKESPDATVEKVPSLVFASGPESWRMNDA